MIRFTLVLAVGVVILVVAERTSGGLSDDVTVGTVKSGTAKPGTEQTEDTLAPMTVAEARRQASLLSDTYLATLHVVHREYFDTKQRDTLPARALEDVFRQIDERTKGRTRWISVNAPAMNVDHEPKPGFEEDAAKALSNGRREFERVENGVYHRAGAVTLFASCNKCHMSGLSSRRSGRVAALVISLPVGDK